MDKSHVLPIWHNILILYLKGIYKHIVSRNIRFWWPKWLMFDVYDVLILSETQACAVKMKLH